jgi:hypothetical protein
MQQLMCDWTCAAAECIAVIRSTLVQLLSSFEKDICYWFAIRSRSYFAVYTEHYKIFTKKFLSSRLFSRNLLITDAINRALLCCCCCCLMQQQQQLISQTYNTARACRCDSAAVDYSNNDDIYPK